MIRRTAAFAALTLAALVALAAPASAHVDIDPEEAVAGSETTLTFHVEHGLDGTATTGLIVQLPDGVSVVTIPEKDGWTASADDAEHTVTWSGGSAHGEDSFAVTVQLPTTEGELLFPTIQESPAGEVAWIDQEESEAEDSHPAPRLLLIADASSSSTTTEEPTATTHELPGTTLEAEQRDDGNTSAAPWLIGSGLAAAAAVAIGGTILKRRQR